MRTLYTIELSPSPAGNMRVKAYARGHGSLTREIEYFTRGNEAHMDVATDFCHREGWLGLRGTLVSVRMRNGWRHEARKA